MGNYGRNVNQAISNAGNIAGVGDGSLSGNITGRLMK